jgi:hypothetical protein
MIDYARMLKAQEKDNPRPILRGTYLFSNVGTLVHCWGRMQRFPEHRQAYRAEIGLAIGDILMQCRLMELEYNITPNTFREIRIDCEYGCIVSIAECAGVLMDMLTRNSPSTDRINDSSLDDLLNGMFQTITELCSYLYLDPYELEHQGYLHVVERYQQFKEEGWK